MTLLTDSRSLETASLADAILSSQPLSGGLWSLVDFPQIPLETLSALAPASYQECAHAILSHFDFGVSQATLESIIHEAYGSQWHHPEITPVTQMGESNLFSLHLGYGPTFAFKNIALEFLPRLLSALSPNVSITVLGASSGDTINAAHSGVKGTKIRCVFLLPKTGPSSVQRLQALNGITNNPNALTLLADLPFDPLQDIVKKVNAPDFQQFKHTHNITSFNSINIARILAQIVYYFKAYVTLLRSGKITLGEEIYFSVPSGNFGDALAGYYAKKMGLPIKKILITTNENNMLETFFKTGVYQPPKKEGKDFVEVTNAPSMDIAKSSNFERMLYDMCNQDWQKTKTYFDTLATTGRFEVDAHLLSRIQETFQAYASTNEERLQAIKYVADTFSHGIDPHTASGIIPWLRGAFGQEKGVFLETSHVAQFAQELQDQGIHVPSMNEFDPLLNHLKSLTPRDGIDFYCVPGDFENTFPIIKMVIEEGFEKKKKCMHPRKNPEVDLFLSPLHHPLEEMIQELRTILLSSAYELEENIKWNAPNYHIAGQDRITMRIHPPKNIQLIFHRGAKVQSMPSKHLIEDPEKILKWKENDRAVAIFQDLQEVKEKSHILTKTVQNRLKATL